VCGDFLLDIIELFAGGGEIFLHRRGSVPDFLQGLSCFIPQSGGCG
jgi:hypothetical protein